METLRHVLSRDGLNALSMAARPTIEVVSLARCQRWIESSNSKLDGEAGVVVLARSWVV
jgi:hypothetical protein